MTFNPSKILNLSDSDGFYREVNGRDELGICLAPNQKDIGEFLIKKFGGKMVMRSEVWYSNYYIWRVTGKKAKDLKEKYL